MVGKSESHKFLFLNTIKEIISGSAASLANYLDSLIKLLMSCSMHDEDQIRIISAECIGNLFAHFPEELQEEIESGLKNSNPVVRATVAKSIKYAGQNNITEDCKLMLQMLCENLIKMKSESDPEIKKNCLEALNTVIHFNPDLLQQYLKDVQEFAH